MSITPAPADFGATERETGFHTTVEPEQGREVGPDATDPAYCDDLARAERLERAQRRRDAEVIALRQRISDVENRHGRLLRSTSWQVGARLARLLLRSKAPEAFQPRFPRYKAPGNEVGRSPEQVTRLLATARAGLPEAALADLGRLRDDWKASESVRALCERAMVLIEAESPDPALRARGLARLRALRHWGAEPADGAEIAFLDRAIAETLPGTDRDARFVANDWLNPDLMLLGRPGVADPAERIAEISRALRVLAGVGVARADSAGPARLDNLAAPVPAGIAGGTLVSVILVAQSAATLPTALASLRAQSWRDLEILVVDDASEDATAAIIAEAAAADARVVAIRSGAPVGLDAARNLALARARGTLVACLDAAAWAHPARIERQARALLAARKAVALDTTRLQATETLRFQRPPFAATLVGPDPAGLMFHREPVLGRAEVRDAVELGDGVEFVSRLGAIFGANAIAKHAAPLTITRAHEDSRAVPFDRGA